VASSNLPTDSNELRQPQRWARNRALKTFVWVAGALSAAVIVPSSAMGLVALAVVGRAVGRRWGAQNGVWAALLIACVLASSRDAGLQYWKLMRFLPAVVMCWFAYQTFKRATPAERTGTWWFGGIVLGVALVAAVFSEFPRDALFEAILLATVWPVLAVCAHVEGERDTADREAMLLCIAVAVIVVSGLSAAIQPEGAELNGRFRGIFGNPNELSHWWLLVFVVLGMRGLREGKAAYLAAVAATAVLLSFTGTRGAFIAVMLSILGYLFTRFRVPPFAGWFILLVLSGWAIASPETFLNPAKRVLPESLVREETVELGGGRLVAWEFGWSEVMDDPWIGHGGGYEERIYKAFEKELSLQNHQGFSHNSWLAFAINFGIPGGTVMILALMCRLKLFSGPFALIALPPILTSLAVEGWLTAPLSASSPLFFAVAGLAGASGMALSNGADAPRN
jgi:hypothetical protein